MSPTMSELYATGVALARKLGRAVEDVPKPFQLNELEDYVQRATATLKAREEAKARAEAEAKSSGSAK